MVKPSTSAQSISQSMAAAPYKLPVNQFMPAISCEDIIHHSGARTVRKWTPAPETKKRGADSSAPRLSLTNEGLLRFLAFAGTVILLGTVEGGFHRAELFARLEGLVVFLLALDLLGRVIGGLD